MFNSSFIPDTYALATFERSKSGQKSERSVNALPNWEAQAEACRHPFSDQDTAGAPL